MKKTVCAADNYRDAADLLPVGIRNWNCGKKSQLSVIRLHFDSRLPAGNECLSLFAVCADIVACLLDSSLNPMFVLKRK